MLKPLINRLNVDSCSMRLIIQNKGVARLIITPKYYKRLQSSVEIFAKDLEDCRKLLQPIIIKFGVDYGEINIQVEDKESLDIIPTFDCYYKTPLTKLD